MHIKEYISIYYFYSQNNKKVTKIIITKIDRNGEFFKTLSLVL
jgi:hypothetical protein